MSSQYYIYMVQYMYECTKYDLNWFKKEDDDEVTLIGSLLRL